MSRSPDNLDPRQDWHDNALCAQTDPDMFYPDKGQGPGPAREVCMACHVRPSCLEHALDNGESQGIWGGMTPKERAAVKRRRGAALAHGAEAAS